MKTRIRRLAIRGTLALALLAAMFEIALRLTPFPVSLESEPPVSAEFLDRNGKPLRTLLAEERRFSRRCALAEVSPNVIAATLSAEDKRFHSHCGVDFLATVRAM
ncbi:MAG: transglycosylase domain-containing protein, partial [Chthoniobacteraceae bacterium]